MSENKIHKADRKPLRDIKAGGVAADVGFKILYNRYAGRLFNRLQHAPCYAQYGNSPELAEDIHSETFFQFFLTINQFEEKCGVYTWLCYLAHNKLMEHFRSKSYNQQYHEDQVDEQLFANLESHQDIEKDVCLEQCMDKLVAAMADVVKKK